MKMKRWLVYTLLSLFMFAGMPVADTMADQGHKDREKNSKNAAMRMKPRKRSKVAAKKRSNVNKDRKKQMADIRKSMKQRSR